MLYYISLYMKAYTFIDDHLHAVYGYLSRKDSYWLFKIFEIQKGRTFNFNDILRLCTIVVKISVGGSFKK